MLRIHRRLDALRLIQQPCARHHPGAPCRTIRCSTRAAPHPQRTAAL
jgi:hypothetical protein